MTIKVIIKLVDTITALLIIVIREHYLLVLNPAFPSLR